MSKQQEESLNAWTNNLIKSLQTSNAAKAASTSAFRDADVIGSKFAPMALPEAQNANDPGLGSRIIDLISRPLYAAAGGAKEAVQTLKGENNGPNTGGVGVGAFKGLAGEDHNTFRDVINEANPDTPDALKGIGGFIGDVLLDPLNLIPVGPAVKLATAPFRAAKIAKVGARAADAERLFNESRLARDAETLTTGKHSAGIESDAPGVVGAHAAAGKHAILPDDVIQQRTLNVPEPARDYSKEIELQGFTPEQYHKAVDDVIRVGNVINPSQLSRISGVKYGEASRIMKQMEVDGILGPTVKKVSDKAATVGERARGTLARPVLVTQKPAGIWGEDVVNNSGKIPDAATVANAHAPETVQSLPVENLPANKVPLDLTPKGQGIMGSKAISDGLKVLMDADGKPLFKAGVERAQALRKEALPAWKAQVETRAAEGVKPVLFAGDGTPYVLSIPHVLDKLPESVANDMVFGASWGKYQRNANLYHTQIGRGMAEALRVDDLGLPLIDRYKQVLAEIKKASPNARARKGRQAVPVRQMVESAKALVDNTRTIRAIQYELTKTLQKKDLQDAAALAKAKSAEIINSVTDPLAPTSQAMGAITGVGSDVLRAGQEIGASANAASIAAKETADIVAKVAPEADTSAARAAFAVKRERIAGSPNAKVSARVQNHLRVVENEADDLFGVPIVDLGVRADNHLNGIVDHLMHPIRSKTAFGYGHEAFANAFRSTGIEATARNVINYNRELNNLSKEFGRPTLETAFSAFKRGEVPVEPGAAAAYEKMGQMVNHIFDTKEPFIGSFWRSGAGLKVINDAMHSKGIKHSFDEGTNVADQWKTWDIEDPMDFLAKANDALTHVAGKQAFGTSFSHTFGAATPRPGYVKMRVTDDDILGPFIDTSKFYPKETAEMMTRLEHALNQPVSFRGEKGTIAGIVNHLVDPVMQIWKPFMTILRPGHHIRNVFGDVMMGLLDGVSSPNSYRKGLKMMQAGGRLRSTGAEGLNVLEAGNAINGGSKMSTVRLRGRNVDLSYDNGYILANKHGLLPAGHAIEDLEKAGKGIEKFQGSLPMRAASRLSEESGGFTRLGHFSNLMERKSFTRQFATLDEAAAAAATQVKKFHPDVHGLTPFERKYMRRLIPFYSWIRQALPVVMNTMITKPGRLNVVNKAQYNAAQAMGLNPDSLSDPFPTDKLYPSFVTAHLTGPWFGDTTFNLGSPQEGILGDTLNGNPLRNLVGMVNPLLKAPLELGTGTNISTGVPIRDVGEYVDSQLPVINQVAGISGYSPTGTVTAVLQGLPVPDPQRAVARGEKAHFFNSSLANFLTGLGIQSVDKPSYQKIAKTEGSG